MRRGQGFGGIVVAAAVAAAIASPMVAAASTTGEIVGRVVDAQTHEGVKGVSVTAISTTGSYRAVTDRSGYYTIVGAQPNTYLLSVTAPGFGTLETLGGAVEPGQAIVVDLAVDSIDSRIDGTAAPNALAIFRPGVVADSAALTAAAADWTNGTGGSYGLYSMPSVVGTLPSITLDEGVNAHVRGSRMDEVGYAYDGVGAVDPITGIPATNLIDDGVVRLLVDAGGDATAQEDGVATVDPVVSSGTYPPHGSITTLVQSPTFYNGLNYQYGAASPDRDLSWFVSGVDWDSGYDWGTRGAFVAGAQSAETGLGDGFVGAASPARDQVVNVHFRPGGGAGDLQFLAATGFERFDDLLSVRMWPSTDPIYGISRLPAPVAGLCNGNGLALYPGQPTCTAGVGDTTDHVDQNFALDKLQYARQIGSSARIAADVATLDSSLLVATPFGDAPFADAWEDRRSVQHEATLEYEAAAGSAQIIRTGAGVDASANALLEEFVSSGDGVVAQAPTRDLYAWVSDTIRATQRLTFDAGLRVERRTYGRLAAPALALGGAEHRGGAAYAVDDRTIVRAEAADELVLPFAAMAERIVTRAPDFGDIAPSDRIAALEAPSITPRGHSLDASIERDLGGGRSVKATLFSRQTPDMLLSTGSVLGQPAALGEYRVHGFDAELQFLRSGTGVNGYLDYTHTRALSDAVGDLTAPVMPGAAAAGALFPVAYVAPDVANLVLAWHRGRFNVNPVATFTTGYPYGVGRFTYNDLNCPLTAAGDGGDPALPCGAIVKNPNAYADPHGGACGAGACTRLIDPAESAFADGRVCCAALTASLNVSYALAARTSLGLSWQNATHASGALALTKNPYIPASAFGPPGSNGFLDYGTAPYIPAALDGSEEYVFTITQRL